MTFYEKSYLQVEWTNQHGCGNNHVNVDCDIIIQYMCGTKVRDGTSEDTIEEQTREEQDANGEYVYGMHESWENYRKCTKRNRNGGLFAADQGNLQNAPATRTRQDNNGQKYGFECPEERDYYPYWHPTPWKDIAVFTSNPARCDYFIKHSQNVEDKWWCESDATDTANVEQFNNPKDCKDPYWKKVESWNIEPPKCFPSGWNRDNHLGNGVGGYANTYKWVLPTMSDLGKDVLVDDKRPNRPKGSKIAPCVLRLRYNISSGDFHGGVEYTGVNYDNGGYADSTMNGKQSPVQQDPYVLFGKKVDSADKDWYLRLAIDTSQFARTFQDRSHLFFITGLPLGHVGPIYNLMVRGKRGNIVDTYPAVEYDFTPNQLSLNLGDWVHFQWTGCDTNPNDAGEGRASTDRSNFVVSKDGDTGAGRGNYPKSIDKIDIFGDPNTKEASELVFKMAFINQYGGKQCKDQSELNCCYTKEQLDNKHTNNNGEKEQDVQNCFILNGNNANYFDGGLVKMIKAGTFNYMSTRNNNFTNRSQKGVINVSSALSPVALAATVVGAAGFVAAGTIAGGAWFAQTHPTSAAANLFSSIKA
jgi:hypothetical protein